MKLVDKTFELCKFLEEFEDTHSLQIESAVFVSVTVALVSSLSFHEAIGILDEAKERLRAAHYMCND